MTLVGAMEKRIITFFTMGLLRTPLKREMEEIIASLRFFRGFLKSYVFLDLNKKKFFFVSFAAFECLANFFDAIKWSSLQKRLSKCIQGPYSQHFIFFVTNESSPKAKVLVTGKPF